MNKDHVNYSKRIIPLRRWHPDRLVAESTGHTPDARGDESLYKPTTLGTAWASIRTVTAGENRPFELVYRAGTAALKPGAIVKFWMAGQGSLGTAPQVVDPTRPGYVEIVEPAAVVLETICDKTRLLSLIDGENPPRDPLPDDMIVGPITIGFKVSKGELRDGMEVRIRVGLTGGFHWKKLSGRKEFKVIIEPGFEAPRQRLPEPVRIDIQPLKAERGDLFLPATVKPGDPVHATISIRDRFDNRVPFDGAGHIEWNGTVSEIHLNNGMSTVTLGRMADKAQRVLLRCEGIPRPAGSNWCLPSDGMNLYFGDMHAHDFQSTAEGYPSDCYLWARDEKRLDFLSLPVQVHRWIDNEKWAVVKHLNEYFLEEGRFVTFLAFEWQHSEYGDKVIHYLGGDMPYLPVDDPRYGDVKGLYAALKTTDAFIISHHPGYQLGLHVPGTRWDTIETDVDRLLEIWSMHGSSEGYDLNDRPLIPPRRTGGVYEGLRRGVRMGVVGGSDSHTARPGGSWDDARPYHGGLCAVWAEGLTRRSLFSAFMARRTYALTGARIILRFIVNEAPMGSEIPFAPEARIRVDVWAPDRILKVEILKNTAVWKTVPGTGDECHLEDIDRIKEPAFYHCRVTQADGHLAVCSPVWLG